ncbi:neuronal acetylcholine receptor subunit alpha-5-like [Physella acuta]|uniref:neuronal acetylcholine receptor subunit alpha-5-like n=1 Tax=Physella acuta TaxID=109671 RepID=UPI0027DBAB75|nr:neuronal acetylcholine receptor subunit alpha-5-like [Physella acuta]
MASCLSLFAIVLVLTEIQCNKVLPGINPLLSMVNNLSESIETRPVYNKMQQTIVRWTFSLTSIQQVDGDSQSFSCTSQMAFDWKNEYLNWNPGDHGGDVWIYPRLNAVWRPQFVFVNGLQESDPFNGDDARVLVFYNGFTRWETKVHFKASCEIDESNYPTDVQKCTLQLVSRKLPYKELRFKPLGKKSNFTTFKNNEWELVDLDLTTYNETDSGITYSAIKITIKISRKLSIFHFILVFPGIFISFASVIIIAVPGNAKTKLGLGITEIFALVTYVISIAVCLPKSASVPRMTMFLYCNIAFTVLTVGAVFLIHAIYEKKENEERRNSTRDQYTQTSADVLESGEALQENVTTVSELTRDRTNSNTKCHHKNSKRLSEIVSSVVFIIIWIDGNVLYFSMWLSSLL